VSSNLADVTAFIRKHYPISETWGNDLEKWVTWAENHRFLFEVMGCNGLVGVAIARPVAGIHGGIDNNDWHDEAGHCVFLDLVIAETKAARQAVAFGILARFGEREFVAFRRRGKLKIHKQAKARKALLR
jgi:hypothetical protein